MSQFTQVHAEQKQRLLTRKKDVAGNEYIYLKGVGSTAAGSVVTYDEAGATTLIAANAVGPVAVAQAAVDSTSEFGWYMISGKCAAACDAGITDNVGLFIDGTAGRVDDTTVTGDKIVGMVSRGTDASNLVLVQMSYPFVTDSLG